MNLGKKLKLVIIKYGNPVEKKLTVTTRKVIIGMA